MEKFKPGSLFLCEVRPLRRFGKHHNMNSKIDQWKSLLRDNYREDESIQNINLNQQLNAFCNSENTFC